MNTGTETTKRGPGRPRIYPEGWGNADRLRRLRDAGGAEKRWRLSAESLGDLAALRAQHPGETEAAVVARALAQAVERLESGGHQSAA